MRVFLFFFYMDTSLFSLWLCASGIGDVWTRRELARGLVDTDRKMDVFLILLSPPRLSAGLIPTLTKQIASNFNYLCIQPLSPSTTRDHACANERTRGMGGREA